MTTVNSIALGALLVLLAGQPLFADDGDFQADPSRNVKTTSLGFGAALGDSEAETGGVADLDYHFRVKAENARNIPVAYHDSHFELELGLFPADRRFIGEVNLQDAVLHRAAGSTRSWTADEHTDPGQPVKFVGSTVSLAPRMFHLDVAKIGRGFTTNRGYVAGTVSILNMDQDRLANFMNVSTTVGITGYQNIADILRVTVDAEAGMTYGGHNTDEGRARLEQGVGYSLRSKAGLKLVLKKFYLKGEAFAEQDGTKIAEATGPKVAGVIPTKTTDVTTTELGALVTVGRAF